MLTDGRADRPSRRESLAIVAAATLLCAAVAAYQGMRENGFGNMGFVHMLHARSVLAGVGFGRDYGGDFVPDLFVRPVYTLFIALPVAVAGEHWQTLRVIVAAMQGALLGVTALAVAAVLRHADAPRAARAAAWATALHPVLVSQASAFVDTTIFTASFVGAYALAWSAPPGGRWTRWLAVGAVLGLALLTRSTALMLAPALALVVRRASGSWRAALPRMALVAVTAAVVLVPWFLRNHALTGRWMLSTVDGVNLWMGNNENTAKFLDEERSLDELPGRARFDSSFKFSVADQLESRDAASAAAGAFIRERPGEAAALAVRKAGDLWSVTPAPRTSRSTMRGLKDVVGVAWTLPLYLLALVGAVSALRAGGARRALAIGVLVTAVCFTVPHAIAWGGTRLRAPVDPLLIALAAIGAVAAWDRLRPSGTPPAADP